MRRNTLIALATAGLGLTVLQAEAQASDRRSDVDVAVALIGGDFAAFIGSDGFYAHPYDHYRPGFGRYNHWNRGHRVRTEVVVTRGGYLKRIYYRRGRIVDSEIIGRVDRRGNWRYFDRGFDDHPRYHRRGDYRDHRYDGRVRSYRRSSRYDDRWDDRYDRRWDRYDDRRDRRDDRYDDRRDRRDDRRDDRDDRRDDRRDRDYRQDSRFDGTWRGDETSVRNPRVYESDAEGLVIRSKQGVVGRLVIDD